MLILLETKKKKANRSWLIKNLKSNPISLFVLLFFFPNVTTIMLILLETKKNNANRSWFIKNLKNNPISLFVLLFSVSYCNNQYVDFIRNKKKQCEQELAH
jgi:uncharacterized protein YlaI